MELRVWWHDFVNLVFPAYCLGCEQGLESREELICTVCRARLPVTNYHEQPENEVQEKFVGRIPIHSAQAYLYFQKRGLTQRLIHRLKYENYPEIALLLGRWYGGQLCRTPLPQKLDWIAPVPLHPRKQRERGYNQSDGFAEGLSEILEVPWKPDLLRRTAHRKSQTRKGALGRLQNVERLFVASAPQELSGKHVLIVDDVLTTGATLESCAQAALDAGARKVSLATIAYASDW